MSIAAKQRARLKTIGKVWSVFEQIQVTDKLRAEHQYLRNVHSIYRNTVCSVHMFAVTTSIGAVMQCDLKPHLPDRILTWEECQRVKDELFSPDAVAMEMFPAASIAWRTKINVRVLYVMPVDWEVPWGLHLPTAFGGQA